MKKPKELFKSHKEGAAWPMVFKDHENLFVIGCESILYRNLLNEFFNSKSDANKYLSAEQQEDLETEFSKWCANYRDWE